MVEEATLRYTARRHMHQTLFILGREPALSVAEIEAVADSLSASLTAIKPTFAVLQHLADLEPKILERLGGTIKLASVIAEWTKEADRQDMLQSVLSHCSVEWLANLIPEGRVEYGVSTYGLSDAQGRKTRQHFLGLKKSLKSMGRSARFVTSNEPTLSAVTLVRQGLMKHGREFIVAADENTFWLAITTVVQGYQAYGLRDFGRPKANPKSGMIPPKLAQILLNLAQVKPDDVVLDPFCGSGTILQEAVLLGVKQIHGSDADTRVVADSQENIRWLFKEFPGHHATVEILKRDVADRPTRATVVVTEPSLGKPLRGHESASGLNDQLRQLEKLYLAGFRRWAETLPPGGRVAMIWPEYTVQGQLRSPQIEAAVTELGFNLQPLLSESAIEALAHPERSVLRYGRPDALVRRQIRKWIYTPTAP